MKEYGDAVIGGLLLSARCKLKLSSRELGMMAGVPAPHLIAIEKGRRALTDKISIKIEKALGREIFDAEEASVLRTRRNIRRLLNDHEDK